MKKIIGFLLFGLVVLTGCAQAQPQTGEQSNQSSALTPDSTALVQQSSDQLSIDMDEFSFAPSDISLTAGTSSDIVISNTGSMMHNYAVADLDIFVQLAPGESETITITPKEAGVYESVCTIGNHAALGMTGTVTVK